MSEEKTPEEVRHEFLSYARHLVGYWVNEKTDPREIAEGVIFSLLVAIDGCVVGLPAFILAPSPHQDDKEDQIENDEDWYPENLDGATCDIGGGLHDDYLQNYSTIPITERKA